MPPNKMMNERRTWILAFGLAVLGFPQMAHAESLPSTKERARALHEAAVKELDARGPARACPMFEEVTTIAPESWGGWMMLGECRKREGRLASAHRAYSNAAEAAMRLGHIGQAQQSTRKAAALESQLAKLVLELSNEVRLAPELEVLVDGKPITISGATTSVPVDRGDHTVVVKAKGKPPIERTRSLLIDGAQATVNIDQWSSTTAKETKDKQSHVTMTYRKKETYMPPIPKWQRTTAWITVSAGAAGILGGSIAGLVAISRKNESDDGHCVNNECDHEGLTLRQGSLLAGNVSTGLFVAGGILAAAGVTLAFVPLSKKQTVGLVVAPTRVGMQLTF